MTHYDYDLFVIGAGSGGVRAARIAATHGAKVAIAEEYRFGGTCVIRGCVPKKLLVYASRFRDEFEDAAGFGWTVGESRFDWPTLIANKDKEIARLEGIYKRNLERAGVAIFESRAVLEGPHTVRLVKLHKTVRAKTVLIATGGWPNLDAELEGCEHVITSNEAFHLNELPRRVIVAGGGYIAVEFAGIFAGLGADTTLIYRGPKILRGFDEDLRDSLMEELPRRGIRIVTEKVLTRIDKTAGGLVGHVTGGARLEADTIMFAIGRSPNTAGLGLDLAGVATTRTGAIKVDAHSRTNVESIYAVGDVTDRVNLTPVAIREGHAFADSMYGGRPWITDYEMIPTAVFSTPEIGTVGMTEAEARAQHGEIDLYKARFRPMKGTLSGREERMLMKLIVEAKGGRVVGCHIVGPDAAEMVQLAAIAMRMGATKTDFDRTMALHPSAAEELVTMREKWVPPAG
ncbi:MAG: glutathione-disulfide reductase [Hyphomicrobiaceae bacterium]|nr:glutathione-disulfide reductase [Hyphomicrobiaceae bacterium]